MIWKFITKSKLNVLLFLWIVAILITCMAIVSSIPVLALRYFYLPKNEVSIPLDFIHKTVKTASNNFVGQKTAVCDLTKSKDLADVDYSIDLILSLPRNAVNREYGNFGVRGALGYYEWSDQRNFLAEKLEHTHSVRPDTTEKMALLPYKSPVIQALSTLVWSPLHLLGLAKEESQLVINLWAYSERPKVQYPYLLVMIPKEIWVSRASLQLTVRLSGLRWLLKTFPISTFFIFSSIFLLSEIIGVAFILILAYVKLEAAAGPRNTPRTRGLVKSDSELTKAGPPEHTDNNRAVIPVTGTERKESNKESSKESSKKSADKELMDKEPVDKEPVDKEPVDKEPVDKEPVDKEPVDKEPVEIQLLGKEPAEKDTTETDAEKTLVKEADSSAYFNESEIGLLSPEYP